MAEEDLVLLVRRLEVALLNCAKKPNTAERRGRKDRQHEKARDLGIQESVMEEMRAAGACPAELHLLPTCVLPGCGG
jgi:hypothetical protein